ncbi:MAG: anhydro-N-acetylmuramic acid kinase AnmK [Fusobacteriaceae bacterium]
MNKKYCVGLMSGTSLDGVDAVLLEITGFGKNTTINTLAFESFSMPFELENKIKLACNPSTSSSDFICSLNFELGYTFSDAVKKICKLAKFTIENLDFIGSHGQTIWHIPFKNENYFASTLQLGEPAVIAYETKTTVVSNFRSMDMAAGGQGAPLVPFTEYLLFSDKEKGRIFQNIGGIGNLTLLPKNCTLDEVSAFDTGPGNMIIDELCKIFFKKNYDKDGLIAALGNVSKEVLDFMMAHEYIEISPPKSTGREIFGEHYVKNLIQNFSGVSAEDLIATATMFTAKTIAYHYEKYIFPVHEINEIIIAGGGSYNKTLMNFLKELLPQHKVLTGEEFGINSNSKEAIAFAILANETLHGNPSNTKSATGAKENVILGSVTEYRKK